jgi:hypothetical protein
MSRNFGTVVRAAWIERLPHEPAGIRLPLALNGPGLARRGSLRTPNKPDGRPAPSKAGRASLGPHRATLWREGAVRGIFKAPLPFQGVALRLIFPRVPAVVDSLSVDSPFA